MRNKCLLAGASVTAIFLPLAGSFAEGRPSTPAEIAETAKLNRDVSAANAAADQIYSAAMKQYDDAKRDNDALQQKYIEDKRQNDLLQQQYQDKLKANQPAVTTHN